MKEVFDKIRIFAGPYKHILNKEFLKINLFF